MLNSTNITRRQTLAGTAALGAMALPAGAALAATDDPGLAELEAGYARWQSFRPLLDASWDADEADDPKGDRVMAKWLAKNPEPVPADDIKWIGKMLASTLDDIRNPDVPVYMPQDLLDRYDAHRAEWGRWYDRKSKVMRPFHKLSLERERERGEMYCQRAAVRDAMLAIPTTSPRGLLLKLALTVEAETLDGIEGRCEECDWTAEDLFPAIVTDVRAMAGRASA